MVNDNTRLNATWNRFETPIVQHTTIDSDGYGEVPPPLINLCLATNVLRLYFFFPCPFAELNAVELRPPHMDDSGRTKYPVLFRVYARFFFLCIFAKSGEAPRC